MKNHLAIRLTAAALAVTLPFATAPAVSALEDPAPAAVAVSEAADPPVIENVVTDPAENTVTDETVNSGIQPLALPFFALRCLVGLGIKGPQLSRLIPMAAAGDWASIAALFGTAAVACVRGH